jgi:integrase/recombinase XerD
MTMPARLFFGARTLVPFLDSFGAALTESGYSAHASSELLRGVRHFDAWITAQGLDVAQCDEALIARFDAHLSTCECGARNVGDYRHTRTGVRRFLAHLRTRGVLPPAPAAPPPVDLLTEFRSWMLQHRGLSRGTFAYYERALRPFLVAHGDDPAQYDVRRIREYVLAQTQDRSAAFSKSLTTALRSFLRFLAADSRCRLDVATAVPPRIEWRLASMPRYLDAAVIEQVLAAVDRTTPVGLRDHAILLLLARLGLRAGDIVALTLDDFDWGAGTIRVCGKGRRTTRLPLPQDAGDAVLAYLEHGRPRVSLPSVFLCSQAPHRGLGHSSTVSSIARFALDRAGAPALPSRGAHVFRHSAATALLRAGATLETIGTVLRHQSTQTTAHYAKVDTAMLLQVAQPWPAGAPC